MRFLLSLLMLGVSGLLFAQPDTRPLAVPKGSGIVLPAAPPPAKTKPSLFNTPPPLPSKSIEAPEINKNFGKAGTGFANPNTAIEDKLNKANYKTYDPGEKEVQHLGDIRTKSKILHISYRDYSLLDGDIVRVYVDDIVVISAVVLDGNSKGFDIPVEKGLHRIDIEALSEGDSPPNTAEFTILDDDGHELLSNQWSLLLGFRASIGVFRE